MFKNFLITTYRTLFRNKTYFFLGVLGLSLGISCVIALYTIVHFQSHFDTHQKNFDSIYRIIGTYKSGDDEGVTSTVPHPLANGIRDELTNVEAISNLYLLSEQINIPLGEDNLKKIKQRRIAFAQPDLFQILTFNWKAGGPTSHDLSSSFLSESAARKFFGNNIDLESILGKSIILANKHTLIVRGIYEDFPKNTDFPFEVINYYEKQEGVNPYFGEGKIWGRLNGGTQCILKVKQDADISQVTNNVIAAFKKYNNMEGYQLKLQSMSKIHSEPVNNYSGVSFEPKYQVISYTLAIFLALIGSINFINLTTARAVKRTKEVGIRKVMGGLRKDLIFQFMFETFIIILISTGIAFLLGDQMLGLFSTLINSNLGINDVPVGDWIAFSIMVISGMTFLSGLYPALVLSNFKPVSALKIRMSNIDRHSKFPIRKILVGLQFSFSILLIVGAIVIFSQMSYMKGYDMGFTSDGIIQLMFPEPDEEKQKRLRGILESFPEIETVSLHLGSPLANTNNTDKWFNPEEGENNLHTMNVKSIDENYLELFGLELLSGRNITLNDPRENIIITEQAVLDFGLGNPHEAIGKELHTNWGQQNKIVGVIKNFHSNSLKYETVPVSMSYSPGGFYELALSTTPAATENPQKILSKIEGAWDSVYPNLLIEYEFLDNEISSRYRFEDVISKSIGFFVIVALIISILGLYGLTDYMANVKRKEIGIRKVVGAEVKQILVIFLKEVAILLGIAFVISSVGGYFLMNGWLQGFEYRITLGWEVFVGALIATSFVALMTMGSRTFAAARLNPVEVLKDE